MGAHSRKNIMKFIVATLALMLVIASSSIVPEEEMNEVFIQAKAKVDAMAGRESACVQTARATIRGVLDEVKNAQRQLNRMDNGARCKNKRSHIVRRWQKEVSNRSRQLSRAKSLLRTAQNANIRTTVVFRIANRNCNVFYGTSSWRRARHTVAIRKRNVTRAAARLQDARRTLSREQESARRARCACRTRVHRNANNALRRARSLTNERKRTITREHLVICLAKSRKYKGKRGNDLAQACKSKRMPSSYNAKLVLRKTRMARMNFRCKVNGGNHSVRLISKNGRDTTHTGVGMLQRRKGGRWGYVCDDHWDSRYGTNNANVACRAMGFTRANLSRSNNCGANSGFQTGRASKSFVNRFCKKIRNQQFNTDDLKCGSSSYHTFGQCAERRAANLGQSFCSWTESIVLSCNGHREE